MDDDAVVDDSCQGLLFGAGVVLLSVKLWIFTFAAIGVIGHAHLDRTDNIITYIVFVLLAVSAHLAVVVAAAIFPERSKSLLDRAAGCKTTTG